MKQDQIDKKTLEISQVDDEVYTKVQDVGDELPDHAPRFVLLSYPLTLVRRLWLWFSASYTPLFQTLAKEQSVMLMISD
jgi:hypothetical protein